MNVFLLLLFLFCLLSLFGFYTHCFWPKKYFKCSALLLLFNYFVVCLMHTVSF